MPSVRPPRSDEAPRLAEIHVASWRAAYRGLLPDGYLSVLDVADRLPWWRARLTAGDGAGELLLGVADDRDRLCGFSASEPEPLVSGRAEVRTLYLDPSAWGTGMGRLLMGEVVTGLGSLGYREAVLWVHPGNHRARRFYERAGWQATGAARSEAVWGVDLEEVAYRRTLPGRSGSGSPRRRGRAPD